VTVALQGADYGRHVTDPRRARGIAGEDAAARMLSELGYEIVARNFRTRHGELDIVAVDRDCLVFCEVRSRVGRPRTATAYALESIGPSKRLQLRKMALEWFRLAAPARPRTRGTRFDVVAVSLTTTGRVLAAEHLRDAF
jgi:putative endonuclease